MKNRKVLLIIAAAVVLLAAGSGVLAAKLLNKRDIPSGNATHAPSQPISTVTPAEGNEPDDTEWGTDIEYNGETYSLNPDITTVLFLGVDKAQDVDYTKETGAGPRADTEMLFILDHKNKTTKVLTISRETLTEVDVYSKDGSFVYSGIMPICLQYTYGDSAKKSCFLTKRTISELLYETRIDACFSMSMEGIPVVVDALGGIPLTLTFDCTDIDPGYTKGAKIVLDGKQAERFVRYRDKETTGSNNERMARQAWMFQEMFRTFKTKSISELMGIMDQASQYIESDVDAETLKKIASYTLDETVYNLPGETKEGERWDEYHVDEEALKKLILDLFYVKK